MSEDDAARQQQDETRDNWVLRAGAWNEQADHLARLAGGLNEPLIAAAGVTPGHQVLDLASGVGEPAISIAALVGPDGSVTASDLVAEMLAGTERRAKEQGVANMAFQVTPMEELPFDDDSFDVVTCRLGRMYTPSPERAWPRPAACCAPAPAPPFWSGARRRTTANAALSIGYWARSPASTPTEAPSHRPAWVMTAP